MVTKVRKGSRPLGKCTRLPTPKCRFCKTKLTMSMKTGFSTPSEWECKECVARFEVIDEVI